LLSNKILTSVYGPADPAFNISHYDQELFMCILQLSVMTTFIGSFYNVII